MCQKVEDAISGSFREVIGSINNKMSRMTQIIKIASYTKQVKSHSKFVFRFKWFKETDKNVTVKKNRLKSWTTTNSLVFRCGQKLTQSGPRTVCHCLKLSRKSLANKVSNSNPHRGMPRQLNASLWLTLRSGYDCLQRSNATAAPPYAFLLIVPLTASLHHFTFIFSVKGQSVYPYAS